MQISIHALREEGDAAPCWCPRRSAYFYPRPPRGGRLAFVVSRFLGKRYFYPRPPRGGRLSGTASDVPTTNISIHALREEGDPLRCSRISPEMAFLSTPSARRATFPGLGVGVVRGISIHALREEGDQGVSDGLLVRRISIHALREEGDVSCWPPCLQG